MKSELKDLIALMARRPLLSKIHPYKDIHKGESCYVMGDGVSVKWFDLSAFSDKIAIVCNFFVLWLFNLVHLHSRLIILA